MSNIINGYSYPRFRILDTNNNLIQEIDLSITTGGLTEYYIDEDIEHTLEKDNEKVKVYNDGKMRIVFTLNYENYIKKADLLNIKKVYLFEKVNHYKIFIVPRVDVLARQFRVTFDEGFQLNIGKGGSIAVTNKAFKIKLITKKLEYINWIDPDNINLTLPFAVI